MKTQYTVCTIEAQNNAQWAQTYFFGALSTSHLLRPGCCSGHGQAESFKTSMEFPDETLQFIKSHPLMDSAVPSIGDEPWFTKTRVR